MVGIREYRKDLDIELGNKTVKMSPYLLSLMVKLISFLYKRSSIALVLFPIFYVLKLELG